MAPGSSVLTIGISGSSSAGKSTLCALFSLILPPCLAQTALLFLHCDAYGKDFDELPVHSSGVLNAETRDSVHFDRLLAAIDEVKETGQLPKEGYATFDFIEADLSRARAKLSDEFVREMTMLVQKAAIDWSRWRAVCVVDGFLLYHDSSVRERLDCGLFLRTSKKVARERRSGRYGGDFAAEGSQEFWKTRSYFEAVVWPEFIKEHAFLLPGGDVEAPLDETALEQRWQKYGLSVAPKVDMEFEESLRWSVGAIITMLSDL